MQNFLFKLPIIYISSWLVLVLFSVSNWPPYVRFYQEKIRIGFVAYMAALKFIDGNIPLKQLL